MNCISKHLLWPSIHLFKPSHFLTAFKLASFKADQTSTLNILDRNISLAYISKPCWSSTDKVIIISVDTSLEQGNQKDSLEMHLIFSKRCEALKYSEKAPVNPLSYKPRTSILWIAYARAFGFRSLRGFSRCSKERRCGEIRVHAATNVWWNYS